ncbi:hypothetical protein TNCT_306831 [Trichonephila clavata]|uniref:Uncharacterized protein n=1 Tax=Trichonephila clavata TaxID=2740835 RepID=A0A8X6EY93_TRICU|nr:hypothetical protein TNCT_306831 [Trichonephila clavata]
MTDEYYPQTCEELMREIFEAVGIDDYDDDAVDYMIKFNIEKVKEVVAKLEQEGKIPVYPEKSASQKNANPSRNNDKQNFIRTEASTSQTLTNPGSSNDERSPLATEASTSQTLTNPGSSNDEQSPMETEASTSQTLTSPGSSNDE